MGIATEHPGSSDFDFFIGDWHVEHRQLRQRLAGCTEWREFPGATSTRPLLDGAANVDDNILHHPDGTYRALTLRSFDAASNSWSIWWLDGRRPAGLDTPMVGSFDQGRGMFCCDDTFGGVPIKVRFLWWMSAPGKPRWEQAFSADGGAHWETNWTMDFSRDPLA